MYCYRFGYGSPEDSSCVIVTHEERLSYDEFYKISVEVFARIYSLLEEEAIARHYRLYSSSERKHRQPTVRSSEVVTDRRFINEFEERGFKRLEYVQDFSIFGWINPRDYEKGWESYASDGTREFLKDVCDEVNKLGCTVQTDNDHEEDRNEEDG